MSAKIFLPNLNTVRFIAAFLVIIHHIEHVKVYFSLPNHYDNAAIHNFGPIGVLMFFVLSGFLITFLLLKEEEFSNINVRRFYLRRVLRIWPLYYFIVLISLFLLPYIKFFSIPGFEINAINQNLTYKIILFCFFCPHLILSWWGVIPYSSQTWSIGIEEQFYIVWPLIIKYLRKRVITIIIFILTIYVAKTAIYMLPKSGFKMFMTSILQPSFFSSMSIGSFFAILAKSNHNKLKIFIFSKFTQISALVLTLLLISLGYNFKIMNNEIYSILFGILIFNLALNEKGLFKIENRLTFYLGKISYGLYMYHFICIVLAIKILNQVDCLNNLAIYIVSCFLTILISSLSYRFFESYFIKMKLNYSIIISGDLSNRTQNKV